MPKVSETIPAQLQTKVDAAVAWFNGTEDAAGETFKVSGILDAEQSAADDGNELRLILCGGDRCEQRSFRISGGAEPWEISLLAAPPIDEQQKPQAELDPPPGPRLRWLDDILARHEFAVLLFYRGFW